MARIAREQGRSISDVVRESVCRQSAAREQAAVVETQRKLQALEDIRRWRAELLARRGGKPVGADAAALLCKVREERDGQILERLARRR